MTLILLSKHSSVLTRCLVLLIIAIPCPVLAEDDLGMINDKCVLTLGPHQIHMRGLQGNRFTARDFCGDMPDLRQARYTLRGLDAPLPEMELTFHVLGPDSHPDIVRTIAKTGDWDTPDVNVINTIPLKVNADGVYSMSLTLDKGRYTGVITAANQGEADHYVAVYPFSVGITATAHAARPEDYKAESFCPKHANAEWRMARTIEGVTVTKSGLCLPDNPFAIAAFVRGTNHVSMETLMQTRLAPDAVEKGKDLDGDGDPDEIHIRLEVAELNGHSPDSKETVTEFSIAPGIAPGFWVFAPKTRGMATRSFEDNTAIDVLRMPSPTIRVEQGDKIRLTLENTHYMPHTIHLHGVDHPFVKADGEGNDGVPQTSEQMVLPGESRTYEFQPRQPGSMAYHCHVQPGTHLLMGLIGMLVVEENRPNNPVQTFNVGAGHVRYPSAAVRESYDREYDLHYMDADDKLHEIIQKFNNTATIARVMNREYSLTGEGSEPDLFMLNGRSFPYTLRESLVLVGENEKIKLRVLNAGQHTIALHTHGHKPTVTHYDGVELPPAGQITRDVFTISPAQRNDLLLDTQNDGLHSYGDGIWLFHDHDELGITTRGMMPGGNVSAIVYDNWISEDGKPKSRGVSLKPYFTPEYYQGKIPVWPLKDWPPPGDKAGVGSQ